MQSIVAAGARLVSHAGGRGGWIGATAGTLAGATAWTLTEYVTHRFVLHGRLARPGLGPVSVGAVHRHHHGEPLDTVPVARAAACLAMAATGVAAGSALRRVAPAAFARAMGMSWGAGYSVYDLVHWSLHHRAPTTEAGRRRRQRHLRHHFGAPTTNHGVTTGLWDHVFGTAAPAHAVRVPVRHAPHWLDELGPTFRRGPVATSAF